MEIILESLRELVDYELAVVLSLDEDNRLRVRKAMGPLYTQRLDGYSISLKERRDLADIMDQRVPHLFREEEEHLDTYYEVLDLPEGHSCLAAPLVVGESPIGLLTLDHRACDRFTTGVVRFIASLSKLISVSVAQSDASTDLLRRAELLVQERNRLLEGREDAFRDLVGVSDRWRKVLDNILLVSASSAPVLVLGETGTGKEQVARTLHRLSGRADRPFVAVNCSALAPSLAESELFGHERGAFSGAVGLRKGRFELADGGTLFLDEVGDLPLDLQPKLLRVLQDGSFERVGGERSLSVDVRIIAATNVDLADAVKKGHFREDLLYRLDVFPIYLPALRDRDEDVLLLAEHFASIIREREDQRALRLSEEALATILSYPWPGNARELRNAIERAAILARGAEIREAHLILHRREKSSGLVLGNLAEDGKILTLQEAQEAAIRAAYKKAGGKLYGKDGAAAILGVKPTTLQSKVKRLGISF